MSLPCWLQIPAGTVGSPDILQALALRLETQLWTTSGRHFPRLQATLLGYASPGAQPSPVVRVARAACVRDVCQADPFTATELVTGIQVGRKSYSSSA